MRKGKLLCGIVLALALAGCASYATYIPVSSSDAALANPSVQFRVLGSISMPLQMTDALIGGKKTGIKGVKALLLGAAKKKYPNADMVVDITYSVVRSQSLMGGAKTTTTIAEATVIAFN